MGNIVISRDDFKALSSRTRTEIIKLLRERKYTLSEMSKKLRLSSPTIKQHLDILQKATMVEQQDEGRKWKYYALTTKGKNILVEQPSQPFVILLAITTIALIALLFSMLILPQTPAMQGATEKAAAVPTSQADYGQTATIPPTETTMLEKNNALFIAAIIIAAIEGYLIAKILR